MKDKVDIVRADGTIHDEAWVYERKGNWFRKPETFYQTVATTVGRYTRQDLEGLGLRPQKKQRAPIVFRTKIETISTGPYYQKNGGVYSTLLDGYAGLRVKVTVEFE